MTKFTQGSASPNPARTSVHLSLLPLRAYGRSLQRHHKRAHFVLPFLPPVGFCATAQGSASPNPARMNSPICPLCVRAYGLSLSFRLRAMRQNQSSFHNSSAAKEDSPNECRLCRFPIGQWPVSERRSYPERVSATAAGAAGRQTTVRPASAAMQIVFAVIGICILSDSSCSTPSCFVKNKTVLKTRTRSWKLYRDSTLIRPQKRLISRHPP